MNFYGDELDYIHVKFGDLRKMYNFTHAFSEKHPNFVKEFTKYFAGDPSCRFKTPLEVVQYIDTFDIPVKLYFNYTDTRVKDMVEMYAYLIREYKGINLNEDGSWRENYANGLDDEPENSKEYKVSLVNGAKTA